MEEMIQRPITESFLKDVCVKDLIGATCSYRDSVTRRMRVGRISGIRKHRLDVVYGKDRITYSVWLNAVAKVVTNDGFSHHNPDSPDNE
jgi:hypothetical protein